MANPRVVVYCEGAGEAEGTDDANRNDTSNFGIPGDTLHADLLGSAHLLVGRCLELDRDIAFSTVCFERGLRTVGGSTPRGSQLTDKQVVRRLLTWPNPTQIPPPDFVVLLIDSDKKPWRKCVKEMYDKLENIRRDFFVVGVAHRSFEAWLMADQKNVNNILGYSPCNNFGNPEDLDHGEAKTVLNRWTSEAKTVERSERALRRELARHCDLDKVSGACASFKAFRKALREVPLP